MVIRCDNSSVINLVYPMEITYPNLEKFISFIL